jgi:hypothetical protein
MNMAQCVLPFQLIPDTFKVLIPSFEFHPDRVGLHLLT